MQFAVISDLHSNLDALEAVFRDIDARGLKTVYCLGDIVGYGPDPVECVDLVRERCAITIRGNHDDALFNGADRFNPFARDAILWTRDKLKPKLLRGREAQDRWRFLKELPLDARVDDCLFVHGSPRDHVNEYIYREDVYFNADTKLKTIFKSVDRFLFVGHTHLPVVIGDDLKTFVPEENELEFQPKPNTKYIVNVGSVGQPRDRDPRACWLQFDHGRLSFRRVSYDIDAVARRIDRNRSLDPVLGARLFDGT
ncbi:MAG: metallophosphoesterase family protein [Planctomycetota bacterium]